MTKALAKIIHVVLTFLICSSVHAATDRLMTNQTLSNGQFIYSPNGKYSLIMQTDGSLVMYRTTNGSVRHSFAKHGDYAVMQADGNFVEYKGSAPIWNSNSFCGCSWPPFLRITDEGDLRIEWESPIGNMFGGIWDLGKDPMPVGGATTAVQDVTVPGGPPPALPPTYSFPNYTSN